MKALKNKKATNLLGIIRYFSIFGLSIPSIVLIKTSKFFVPLFPKAEIFDFQFSKNESLHSIYVEFLLFSSKQKLKTSKSNISDLGNRFFSGP